MLAALRESSKYVGFWDADLATPLDAAFEVSRVLDEHENVELVMGARVHLLGRSIGRRARRHYLGRVCATLVSLTLDQPAYDTQCGAKLFRRSPATSELFSEPFSTQWLFDVQLFARILCIQSAEHARPAHRQRGAGFSNAGRSSPLTLDVPGATKLWRPLTG